MLPTSRDFFLAFAGTLLAGATPVPIYPPFRADRIAEYAERQSAILANAGARLLVTFREAASVAKLLKPLVPSLEAVVTAEALAQSRAPAPLGPQLHSRAEDLALLQYTSGSTGNPKGVMLTHANLLANVRAIGEALGMRNDDVGVSWLPLYHDMGLIGAWLMPLYFGLTVVVLSPLAFLSRPARWVRAFHRYRGTISAAPNFAYELAAAKVSDEEIQGLDLSAWRAALNGAEPVLPATLDRFAARFASCGFRRETLVARLRPGGSFTRRDDSAGGTRAARGPPRSRRVCARRPRGAGAAGRFRRQLKRRSECDFVCLRGPARSAARSANRE